MENYRGGGSRTRAIDCQGLEAPWPLALARKATQQIDQVLEDGRIQRKNWGGEAGTHRHGGNRDGLTPQGLTVTWLRAESGKGRSA